MELENKKSGIVLYQMPSPAEHLKEGLVIGK